MSSKTKAVAAALAAALLAGCATAPGGAQYVPLIDIKPELAAKRGDVPATCRRLFAAGVPSDQCYCAAKALILSVRSEA